MPEHGIVETLPAGGGLLIQRKGKKEHAKAGFSPAFWEISKQSAPKRKRFLMNFHEESWKSRFFLIWMVITWVFFYQETTEDQNGSLKDRMVQLARVQDITGSQDGIVQGCQN